MKKFKYNVYIGLNRKMGRLRRYGVVIAALLAAAFFVSPCNRAREQNDVSDTATCTGEECNLESITMGLGSTSFYVTDYAEESTGYDSVDIK